MFHKGQVSEEKQLLDACKDNDLSEARRLLSTGRVDVNYQDRHGWTALMFACNKGHIIVARMLLQEFGADVNLKDQYGYTALVNASRNRHITITRMLLLEFGADVDARDNRGNTAFDLCHESCKAEYETIVAELRNATMHSASSAALMPPPVAVSGLSGETSNASFYNMSAAGASIVSDSSRASRTVEHESMRDYFETIKAERDSLEEELNKARAQLFVVGEELNHAQTQLRASNEERDQAKEERDRLLTHLDTSSPFVRYRPHVVGSALATALLPVGRHVMASNSGMHRFAEDLVSSGGAFSRSGRLPVVEHRLHHVEWIKSHENTVVAFEARRQTLRTRRGPDSGTCNLDPSHFSSAQFRVLSALRDNFHELAPATTNRTVRSVYVFQGCSEAGVDIICHKGLANLSSTEGREYFGAGYYTTLNIELAALYSTVACQATVGSVIPVVMFAAWIGTAYPITPGIDYGDNPRRDYQKCPNHLPHSDYYGAPLERGFDCHVACVNDTSSEAVDRDDCQYMEVVFNQETQLLPVAVLWLEKTA